MKTTEENISIIRIDEEYFMRKAIAQAELAAEEGEVPVGAVAVKDNIIIGRSYNQVEKLKDATAHAEMIVITQAANAIGDWRLEGVDIYVTKEPCAMCAGAMVNSRVHRVVFGMHDPRCGSVCSALKITSFPGMLHKVKVRGGLLESECSEIMKDFFRKVRKAKSRPQKIDE